MLKFLFIGSSALKNDEQKFSWKQCAFIITDFLPGVLEGSKIPRKVCKCIYSGILDNSITILTFPRNTRTRCARISVLRTKVNASPEVWKKFWRSARKFWIRYSLRSKSLFSDRFVGSRSEKNLRSDEKKKRRKKDFEERQRAERHIMTYIWILKLKMTARNRVNFEIFSDSRYGTRYGMKPVPCSISFAKRFFVHQIVSLCPCMLSNGNPSWNESAVNEDECVGAEIKRRMHTRQENFSTRENIRNGDIRCVRDVRIIKANFHFVISYSQWKVIGGEGGQWYARCKEIIRNIGGR